MYTLNPSAIYHYFGDEMIIRVSNMQYILNRWQSLFIEMINEKYSTHEMCAKLNEYIEDTSYNELYILIDEILTQMTDINWILNSPKYYQINISGEKNIFLPLKLTIELTNKCHLQCSHCFKECGPSQRQFIDKDALINFLNEISGKINEIQITGGEPMIHPWFLDIIKKAREVANTLTLTTTGHFINKNNINTLSEFDYIQLSFYHHNENDNNDITGGKFAWKKTIMCIDFLNENNVKYSVTNVVRKSLIHQFDDYIRFLIKLNIKEVTFGLLSKLGRASTLDTDWNLSKGDIILFSELLINKAKEYNGSIKINTWEEPNCSNFVFDRTEKVLSCGAGVLDWNIDEEGNIKPCSFFPISIFNIGKISSFRKIIAKESIEQIYSGIQLWESDLLKSGSSTKFICSEIHKLITKQ